MSALSRDDVAPRHVGADRPLDAEILDRMPGEFQVILEPVALVQQAPIADVEPMSHPLPLGQRQPSRWWPSLTPTDAPSGRPRSKAAALVPRILDEE